MNDQDTPYPLTQALIDDVARQLASTPEPRSTEPSREVLDLAWQAAQRHARWRPIVIWRDFHRELLAAADADENADAPTRIPENVDEERSQWTVTREERMGDDGQKVLRFRAHPDHAASYAGRRIEIQIGRDVFDLGVIDPSGTASRIIPAGINLRQAIDLRIGELGE